MPNFIRTYSRWFLQEIACILLCEIRSSIAGSAAAPCIAAISLLEKREYAAQLPV
jgi:hypothetical protein